MSLYDTLYTGGVGGAGGDALVLFSSTSFLIFYCFLSFRLRTSETLVHNLVVNDPVIRSDGRYEVGAVSEEMELTAEVTR